MEVSEGGYSGVSLDPCLRGLRDPHCGSRVTRGASQGKQLQEIRLQRVELSAQTSELLDGLGLDDVRGRNLLLGRSQASFDSCEVGETVMSFWCSMTDLL